MSQGMWQSLEAGWKARKNRVSPRPSHISAALATYPEIPGELLTVLKYLTVWKESPSVEDDGSQEFCEDSRTKRL